MKNFKKVIVGVDADGVLTNLIEYNSREGKKEFKREVINYNSYWLEEMFDLEDVSKLKMYTKAFKIYEKYCKKENPREGASNVINELSKKGFSFNQITARKFAAQRNILGKRYRRLLKKWNKKHGINFDSYKFCDDYNVDKSKLILCNMLNVEVMIEDNANVALLLAQNGIKVILVDAPYNSEVKHENIIRVYDWYQIKDELLKFQEAKKVNVFETETFKKLSRDEIHNLRDEEKENYFTAYKKYLKSLEIDEESLKIGEKRAKFLYPFLKLYIKTKPKAKIIGKENIPYEDGFIVACTHVNSLDQYYVGLALGNRPFTGLMALSIKDTIRGKLFKFTRGCIYINRKDKESRKAVNMELSKRLAHGKLSLIFPEGTRKNKTEEGKAKKILPFNPGVVSIAQKTGAPILLMVISPFGKYTMVRIAEPVIIKATDDVSIATKNLEKLAIDLIDKNIEDNSI